MNPNRRGWSVLAPLLIGALAIGCGSEAEQVYDEEARLDDKKCMEPETLETLQRPLEQQYEDLGLAVDYDRLAPLGRARKDGDGDYSKQVFYNPDSLEQVYHDAAEGNRQARFMVCFYDFAARRIGRSMAQHLASIGCVTALKCTIKIDKLPISLHTESGIRLYEQIWDQFEKEARRKAARWDLFNNSLALFVGLKVAAPTTGGASRALGASSGRQLTTGNTGTVGGQTAPPVSQTTQGTAATSSTPAVVVGARPVTPSTPASTTRSATTTAPTTAPAGASAGTASATASSSPTTATPPTTAATTATPSTTAATTATPSTTTATTATPSAMTAATATTSTTATTRAPTTATATAPIRSVATATRTRGGAGPVRKGQAGEAAVRARYNIGPKVKIKVNGRHRIPDGLTNTVLSEVKNVKKLSFTRQLRDFADHCAQTGKEFHLYVRQDATATKPLLDAIVSGVIELRYIP